MAYRQSMPQLMPTALQDPYGQAFARALGIVKDWCAQRGRTGVQQRFPSYALPDALGAIGDERSIFQGNSAQLGTPETSAAYAGRLRNAWNTWLLGGTAWGMLQAFAAQGYFPEVVCANGLTYSVNGSLALTITHNAALSSIPWNWFFVWFPTAPSSWTSIATPPTSSTAPTKSEIQLLRKIIRTWQSAWSVCMGIAVLVSGSPGIWGAPGSTWGGVGATWDSAVLYWFSPTDVLEWGFPPTYAWGMSGLTWGDDAV